VAKSLAFWFEEGRATPKLELHINFWSLDTQDLNYLDIGLKFDSEESISFKSINVYLPFQISSNQYQSDLGNTICNDRELISAIFNSPVTTTTSSSKHDTFDITFSNKSKLRFFTQIVAVSDSWTEGVRIQKIETKSGSHQQTGTILSFPATLFKITDHDPDRSNYFRFRITLDSKSKLILAHEYKSKDSVITNHFESTEMVDFRINESRNLPAQIRSQLNGQLNLSQVHFFLIRDASSEFKMSHSKYKRCRVLEKEIWNGYLKGESNSIQAPEQMLIYHWSESGKEGEPIDHFSAFAKYTRRDVTWAKIGAVLSIIFILGVFSGLAANYIWTFNDDSVELVETSSGSSFTSKIKKFFSTTIETETETETETEDVKK